MVKKTLRPVLQVIYSAQVIISLLNRIQNIIVGVKNVAHFARNVRGIFDNWEEKEDIMQGATVERSY